MYAVRVFLYGSTGQCSPLPQTRGPPHPLKREADKFFESGGEVHGPISVMPDMPIKIKFKNIKFKRLTFIYLTFILRVYQLRGVNIMLNTLKLEYFDLIKQRADLKETIDALHKEWDDSLQWSSTPGAQVDHWNHIRDLEIMRVEYALRQLDIRKTVGQETLLEWRKEWYTMKEEGRFLLQ